LESAFQKRHYSRKQTINEFERKGQVDIKGVKFRIARMSFEVSKENFASQEKEELVRKRYRNDT
jgi:hypothetical protein